MSSIRATLHDLLETIPDERLEEARGRLVSLVDDPLLRALTSAPIDDEPVTPELAADLDRRREEPSRRLRMLRRS